MSRARPKLAAKGVVDALPLFVEASLPAPPPAPPPGVPTAHAPANAAATFDAPAPTAAAELPVAAREVLGYPMHLLEPLGTLTQLAPTLVCEVVASARLKLLGQHVVLTMSKQAYVVARSKRWPAFSGREFAPLALAVEHDRLEPRRFADWLEQKAADPNTRIDFATAIGDVAEALPPKSWPVGRVFAELGLRLVEVCTGAEVPKLLQAATGGAAEQPAGPIERGAA